MKVSEELRKIMDLDGHRYWAGDNVSKYVNESITEALIEEATVAFEGVLDSLLIDRATDPNSRGTARRLAKMYYYEIMAGRYTDRPEATAFPNDSEDRYSGMLVVRSELKSMCSHHHAPVVGTAYIGVIPGNKVIGLSKYARIAQWCARRGTLQEELCNEITKQIQKATETTDVAVYIEAEHGCCTLRGISATSSLTQTTVLRGQFVEADVKAEFFENIKLQRMSRHSAL
jgi:GTP cyclohydrolase I